jgi:hypothetical protein
VEVDAGHRRALQKLQRVSQPADGGLGNHDRNASMPVALSKQFNSTA